MATDAASSAGPAPSQEPKLPPLSGTDFRVYNRMAESMDYFHSLFRAKWDAMNKAVQPGSKSLSSSGLVALGLEFVSHLTLHHDIEEAHIFPVLARKMPQFKKSNTEGPIQQHREIHKGLDKLGEYLAECKSGERALRREELKAVLDSFSKVLWQHLDEEVEVLGAESMRKYWSKAEMARMPM